jgi:hypothetical protein
MASILVVEHWSLGLEPVARGSPRCAVVHRSDDAPARPGSTVSGLTARVADRTGDVVLV